MANGFKVRVENIVSDGTNLFITVKIASPTQTYDLISMAFPVGTSSTVIDAYMQAIADAGPVVTGAVLELVGRVYAGA